MTTDEMTTDEIRREILCIPYQDHLQIRKVLSELLAHIIEQEKRIERMEQEVKHNSLQLIREDNKK